MPKFTADCMKCSVVWQHISAVRVDGAVTCSGLSPLHVTERLLYFEDELCLIRLA